jgi:outer membrane receptor protein involved in Fe transport
MPEYRKFMSALLVGSAIILAAKPIGAQDRREEEEARADDKLSEGQPDEGTPIIVTGSRIRGAAVAGDVITLDQQAIISAGQIDLGEALRSLPQNFGGGQNPGIGSGGGLINNNINSASSANLRGLGPDATLTLLNGHRLPYDSAFGGVDISAIPLAALDRIEVVPDGASALYGSDAVAGVVNVILRRDFDGIATSAQLGAATDGGYFRRQADIVAGTTWKDGGVLLAYDYARNSEIAARQRSYAGALDPDATLFPRMNRHAVTLTGHQRLGDGIVAKVDALYARRTSAILNETPTITQLRQSQVETITVAPSLEIDLGSGWQARFVGVFGRDKTLYSSSVAFSGGIPTVTGGCYCNVIAAGEGGAEGPLFLLPGGSARLAIGGGFRNNRLDYYQRVNGADQQAFDITRRSRYAYGELFLPFVSPELGIEGVDRLSLSAALRYEDYPGLDRLATPRVGLIYAPSSQLVLRASWARSFKAPTLYQQYIPYEAILLPAAVFGAGTGTSSVMFAAGGNRDLQPERATSWTAGFELRPTFIEGLTITATWFDIDYRDRVVSPIAGSIAAAFRNPGFATLIDFAPDAAELAALIAGAQFGLENLTGLPYDPAQVVAYVDNRNVNVAAQAIRGIDARLSWSGALHGGTLGIDIDASWLESVQQLTPALPDVQLAGTVFNPPEFRLRAAANYSHGGLRVTSALNFTGALEDERFAVRRLLAPSTTIDLGASYDIIAGEGRDPGLTVSITVNNLFDDRPERIQTSGPTSTPYDSTNFSPIGRFVAIGIRRHW